MGVAVVFLVLVVEQSCFPFLGLIKNFVFLYAVLQLEMRITVGFFLAIRTIKSSAIAGSRCFLLY